MKDEKEAPAPIEPEDRTYEGTAHIPGHRAVTLEDTPHAAPYDKKGLPYDTER